MLVKRPPAFSAKLENSYFLSIDIANNGKFCNTNNLASLEACTCTVVNEIIHVQILSLKSERELCIQEPRAVTG